MTNFQMLVVLIGWAILFYLHNRTLKKGEIARLKENLIKDLKDLFNWLDATAKSSISHLEFEEEFAGKVTLIELYISQINTYTGYILIHFELLSKIRQIETKNLIKSEKLPHLDKIILYDTVEAIEKKYHSFEQTNFFRQLWISRRPELYGMSFALGIIVCFLYIIDKLF